MLSGNGRHRRPRQAPALLVAAGVTGSAIAIPLLTAGGASAASGTTWDKVAECESGGAWSADDGGGHYGGLQLTQDEWEAYGGLDYASSPDRASRSQQIAVAERILADQGVGVWPVCGPLYGLAQDAAPAGVDTGVAGDPTPDASESASGSDDASGGTGGLTDSSKSSDGSGDSSTGSDSSGSTDDPTAPGNSGEPGSSPTGSPTDSQADGQADSPTGGATGSPTDLTGPADPSDPSSAPSGDTGTPGASGGAGDASGGSLPSNSPVEPPSESPSGPTGGESDNFQQSLGSSYLVDTGALPEADPLPGSGRHRGSSADESDVKAPTGRAGDPSTSSASPDASAPLNTPAPLNAPDSSDSPDSSGTPDTSGTSSSSGRHAARGDDGAQDALVRSYTVRPGDTLTSIADSLWVDGGWRQIFQQNETALGSDPNYIVPGQTLDIGAEPVED
ncbi:transglycosylase family protein [Streptomyces sp. NPDC056716]|uniref:transglycosylase family protein n=1 Tax=unclassified Streptomyces TaxID=2593676 RepID=UPI0036C958DB